MVDHGIFLMSFFGFLTLKTFTWVKFQSYSTLQTKKYLSKCGFKNEGFMSQNMN